MVEFTRNARAALPQNNYELENQTQPWDRMLALSESDLPLTPECLGIAQEVCQGAIQCSGHGHYSQLGMTLCLAGHRCKSGQSAKSQSMQTAQVSREEAYSTRLVAITGLRDVTS